MSALFSNTTASSNTAVGYQAGYSNTTGEITAVGSGALYTNTTGFGNTAVGSASSGLSSNAALRGNTTGAANSAFGSGALQATTTGGYNSAFGARSMASNTTGTNNSVFGEESGYGITTGTFNTFIGWASGYAMTTGSKNTILGGYNGNQGNLDIRTASNYIVLSDGDGNPRMSLTGSAVQYEIFSGRALFSWANVGSTSVDLNTLFPNIGTSVYGISLELLTITGTSTANQSTQIIHGVKTISGVWTFSTVSTIGTQTTVATGSGGSTLTLTFISGGQFGRCVVNAITQN
jgi:hypothetical protein